MEKEKDRTQQELRIPMTADSLNEHINLTLNDFIKRHRMRVAYAEAVAEAYAEIAWYEVASESPSPTVRWLYRKARREGSADDR